MIRLRIVLLRPLTQHDHDRIAPKREMPCVEMQSCIREFHVYKAWQQLFFLQMYTFYGPLLLVFVSASSVTCLLADLIQEEGIRLYKGLWKFGQ